MLIGVSLMYDFSNPHWDPKLRPMTGLDRPVAAFLDRHTEVRITLFIKTRSYLELWLPMLETNNRSYLTVAIGCTGGKNIVLFTWLNNWLTISALEGKTYNHAIYRTLLKSANDPISTRSDKKPFRHMHARPAMKLFDLVNTFQSTVTLRKIHEGALRRKQIV